MHPSARDSGNEAYPYDHCRRLLTLTEVGARQRRNRPPSPRSYPDARPRKRSPEGPGRKGTGLLSERTRLQWNTYLAAKKAQATPFGDRDELHRFVIGVHLRGELLTAAALRDLLDQATGDGAERDALASFVEDGLALLASYERLVAAEAGDDDEGGVHGGFMI